MMMLPPQQDDDAGKVEMQATDGNGCATWLRAHGGSAAGEWQLSCLLVAPRLPVLLLLVSLRSLLSLFSCALFCFALRRLRFRRSLPRASAERRVFDLDSLLLLR